MGSYKPVIRSLMQISTAHLPEKHGSELSDESLDKNAFLSASALEYGVLLWVPSDPEKYYEGQGIAPEIMTIMVYARSNGAEYVHFDRDHEIAPDLPTWDW